MPSAGDNSISMHTWKPYIIAFYSIFEDIVKSYNETQKKRFCKVWKYYFKANIDETIAIENGQNLTDFDTVIRVSISWHKILREIIRYQ